MEWFKSYPKDLKAGPLSLADSAPLGDWYRLTSACADLENFGRFETARTYGTRQWMTIAGVSAESIPGVVAAGLASWDGDVLVIHGYDIDQQNKANTRSEQNRELANRRWHNAGQDAKGNAPGNAKGNAPGNAIDAAKAMQRRGEEIREEETKAEERKTDIRPAGGPAGPVGAGDDVPILKLVPEDPSGPDAKKASKPDSVDNVLAVFERYTSTHGHPSRRRPLPTCKTWRAIAARLRDGWSVEDLLKAVDGYHLSPWHLGQNVDGKKHLELELFMRDEEHVTKGLDFVENPPKPGNGKSDIRFGRVGAESIHHSAVTGVVDLRGLP